MDALISRLNSIPNSYYEFVDSVVDYAKSKASHLEVIMQYLDDNEESTPSDIIKFISTQPDFFDDDAPTDMNSLVG